VKNCSMYFVPSSLPNRSKYSTLNAHSLQPYSVVAGEGGHIICE
jgi:hypothetical protein